MNSAAPIVIGGLGGSGTRVVAEILQQAGIFLGSDLNESCDNLWFTLLFKRPHWFRGAARTKESRVFVGLKLFQKAMLGRDRPNWRETNYLARAAIRMAFTGDNRERDRNGRWPLVRAWKIWQAGGPPPDRTFIGWGWKEPNSHLYLPWLRRHFPKMTYIHVIRHGLDMAFSSNQYQLYNWAFAYDVTLPRTQDQLPAASLRFWVEANRRALGFGKSLGADRFLCLNYDRLCQTPEAEINALFRMLKIKPSAALEQHLRQIPAQQKTRERYRSRDCRGLPTADLEAVRELGFQLSFDGNYISRAFVVGLSRSGTTLLRLILDAHPQLAIPLETQFLTHATLLQPNPEPLRTRFEKMVRDDPRWADFHLDEAAFHTALARLPCDDLSGGIRAFYGLYAARFEKSRWGDKTPLYVTCMDRIQRLLPEAKFIHLIRDGRDVAVSLRHLWWGPGRDIRAQARLWVDRIRGARAQALAPGTYLELRYEDLVRKPETVLPRLCDFCGLSAEAAMLAFHHSAAERMQELGALKTEKTGRIITQEERLALHRHTTQPMHGERIARWKRELTAAEIADYQAIAGDLLQNLGYELA